MLKEIHEVDNMAEWKRCPKCSGNMELGEIVDESYMVSGPQKWALQAESVAGFGKRGSVKIISYRCFKCGYLENFAPSEKRKKYEVFGPKEPV